LALATSTGRCPVGLGMARCPIFAYSPIFAYRRKRSVRRQRARGVGRRICR
jgi:hypothetical protein